MHHLARDVAKLLFAGKLREDGLEVEGVIVGKGVKLSKRVTQVSVPGFDTPAAAVLAVVATGRLPGIACSMGSFQDAMSTRMWFCQFGRSGFEFWHRVLGMPQVNDFVDGVITFTRKESLRKVRHELYEMRKEADAQWR